MMNRPAFVRIGVHTVPLAEVIIMQRFVRLGLSFPQQAQNTFSVDGPVLRQLCAGTAGCICLGRCTGRGARGRVGTEGTAAGGWLVGAGWLHESARRSCNHS